MDSDASEKHFANEHAINLQNIELHEANDGNSYGYGPRKSVDLDKLMNEIDTLKVAINDMKDKDKHSRRDTKTDDKSKSRSHSSSSRKRKKKGKKPEELIRRRTITFDDPATPDLPPSNAPQGSSRPNRHDDFSPALAPPRGVVNTESHSSDNQVIHLYPQPPPGRSGPKICVTAR